MSKRIFISRRTFLSHCTAIAAATGLPRWFVERELSAATQTPSPRSANDRPGLALIGCGGMGRATSRARAGSETSVALCDVDTNQAAAVAKQFAGNAKVPDQVTDFRRVLDRKDVQVIVNATPITGTRRSISPPPPRTRTSTPKSR